MTALNRYTENTLACLEYFHTIWVQLQQLLSERRDQKLREQREFRKICGAVEAIVEGTDVRLRGVCNYRNQLREGACNLLQHIESLVDSMPSPIVVDDNSLISDPLVRTLLTDTKTIHRLFLCNRHLQEFFASIENSTRQEVFALLFLHHKEKTVLGTEIHGEILLREVQQTAFSFYGHRLVAPSPSEEAARIEMMISLFETVVRHIKGEMLQQKMILMKQQKGIPTCEPEENINNPEVYIRILVEQLGLPEQLIALQDSLVRVNNMGIKLPLKSDTPSNLLRLNEVQVGDRQSNLVTLIRYPKDGLSDRYVPGEVAYLTDEISRPSCTFTL